jgi:hypothetical protein
MTDIVTDWQTNDGFLWGATLAQEMAAFFTMPSGGGPRGTH